MPCLSSSADSALNESIRVSNAESQFALPLMTTTIFGVSAISSPNGSAVCTGAAAGVSAVAGGVPGAAGELAPGAGVAGGAGLGVAGGAGAGGVGVLTAGGGGGVCASTLPSPSEIAAAGTSATMA